jgi:hypothetical protein
MAPAAYALNDWRLNYNGLMHVDACRRVISDVSDHPIDGAAFHLVGIEGAKERCQFLLVLYFRVDPGERFVAGQNHGHPIVDLLREVVSVRSQNRARLDRLFGFQAIEEGLPIVSHRSL